jgi:hypothetical protein
MRSLRTLEMTVLGYPIERIEEHDQLGIVGAARFEVLCPWSSAVLRNFVCVRQAKRYVLACELAGIHRRPSPRINNLG